MELLELELELEFELEFELKPDELGEFAGPLQPNKISAVQKTLIILTPMLLPVKNLMLKANK